MKTCTFQYADLDFECQYLVDRLTLADDGHEGTVYEIEEILWIMDLEGQKEPMLMREDEYGEYTEPRLRHEEGDLIEWESLEQAAIEAAQADHAGRND